MNSSAPQPQYLKDLESCGISTSNNLREILTTCQDPVEAIKQFQNENSIKLSSLKPVMKLLDLHGIRRTEYHETVNTELTDKLLAKIKELGEKQSPENVFKLEQQLERSFRLYRVPRIKPIVLETLNQLPKVADRYLKLIICDKELYDCCSVKVRQQIWVKNESLFLEAVDPVIESYISEKERLLISMEKSTHNFFTRDTTKARRHWKQIQDLITMVGERELLYTRLIDIIRERFLRTGAHHFCSLRFELLMLAHDKNLDVVKSDPCHDFAWCLDACLKAKHLDAQQTTRLKNILDSGRKGANKSFGEMGMIAADPHLMHFISSMVVKVIKNNASTGESRSLPREQTQLQLLIRLLSFGTRAKELMSTGETVGTQNLVNTNLFTAFVPAFTVMVAEDLYRLEVQNDEDAEDDEVRPVSDSMAQFLRDDPVAGLVWLHYLVNELLPTKRRTHDVLTVARYVEWLPNLAHNIASQEPWLHMFVHRLVSASAIDPTIVSSEQIARPIVQDLMINSLELNPYVKFHLLQLCVHLRAQLPDDLIVLAGETLTELRNSPKTDEELDEETPHSLLFYNEFDKWDSSGSSGAVSAQLLRRRESTGAEKEAEEAEMDTS